MECLLAGHDRKYGEDAEETDGPLGPAPSFAVNDKAPNHRTKELVSNVVNL